MRTRVDIVMPPGCVFIRVAGANQSRRQNMCLEKLDKTTTFVHIHGMPFAWAIKAILEKAPNLKTIQVIPSLRDYMLPSGAFRLCKDHGIAVVTGHALPTQRWKRRENRKPSYVAWQKMFLSLDGKSRDLFEELCALNIRDALVTRRYFCLSGEPFMTQSQLSKEFGLSKKKNRATSVSVCVHAVMRYLGKRTSNGDLVVRRASTIRRRVKRMRSKAQNDAREAAVREEFVRSFGYKIPAKIPPGKMEVLRGILACFEDGRIDKLAKAKPRMHMILLYRFGLERWQDLRIADNCRDLNDIGLMLGGITRERVRQLEAKALAFLGIAE